MFCVIVFRFPKIVFIYLYVIKAIYNVFVYSSIVLLVIFIHKSQPTNMKNVYFQKYITHKDKFWRQKLKYAAYRYFENILKTMILVYF